MSLTTPGNGDRPDPCVETGSNGVAPTRRSLRGMRPALPFRHSPRVQHRNRRRVQHQPEDIIVVPVINRVRMDYFVGIVLFVASRVEIAITFITGAF